MPCSSFYSRYKARGPPALEGWAVLPGSHQEIAGNLHSVECASRGHKVPLKEERLGYYPPAGPDPPPRAFWRAINKDTTSSAHCLRSRRGSGAGGERTGSPRFHLEDPPGFTALAIPFRSQSGGVQGAATAGSNAGPPRRAGPPHLPSPVASEAIKSDATNHPGSGFGRVSFLGFFLFPKN